MRTRTLTRPEPTSSLRPVRGPRDWPLRSAARLQSDPYGLAQDLRRNYGDVSSIRVLGRDVVIAQGPEAAWQLVRNHGRTFANAPVYDFALGRFFERGILLMDSAEHHHHRLVMQQAFTSDRLAGYQDRMTPLVADALDAIPLGEGVDMRTVMKSITLDVALEVFVGETLPRSQADEINRAFIDLIEAGGSLIRFRLPGAKWDRGIRARRTVDDFFRSLLPARRADPGPDLFSTLCHAHGPDCEKLSDDDVLDQMRFMLFAAHDTATIALTGMAYHLGTHPEWQERARREVLTMPERLGYDDLDAMPTMDLIMKEALRLRPPVPAIPRAAVRDTELCGHFIPAGTFVVSLVGSNHRLPDVWPNPDAFDPERFAPDRAEQSVHRMAWMPFGGGAHKCIGMSFARMEAFTVMHAMLRSLRAHPNRGCRSWGLKPPVSSRLRAM